MRKKLNIFLMAILLMATSQVARPQGTKSLGITVEIDPAPFFSGGYSFAAGYEFDHVRFSVNLFSSELPDFAVQKNWNAKIDIGSAIRFQYYFNKERTGFYPGIQFGVLRMRYHHDSGSEYSYSNQVAITPTVGYRWFPFNSNGFYVMPAIGIGFTLSTSKEIAFGNEVYDQNKPAFIAALHLGWRF